MTPSGLEMFSDINIYITLHSSLGATDQGFHLAFQSTRAALISRSVGLSSDNRGEGGNARAVGQ